MGLSVRTHGLGVRPRAAARPVAICGRCHPAAGHFLRGQTEGAQVDEGTGSPILYLFSYVLSDR